MYICLECGEVFEEPHIYYERHGSDPNMEERRTESPCCFNDYTETFQCDMCNEYINDDYIQLIDGKKICQNCYYKKSLGD